jgi:hypothetical protein
MFTLPGTKLTSKSTNLNFAGDKITNNIPNLKFAGDIHYLLLTLIRTKLILPLFSKLQFYPAIIGAL